MTRARIRPHRNERTKISLSIFVGGAGHSRRAVSGDEPRRTVSCICVSCGVRLRSPVRVVTTEVNGHLARVESWGSGGVGGLFHGRSELLSRWRFSLGLFF